MSARTALTKHYLDYHPYLTTTSTPTSLLPHSYLTPTSTTTSRLPHPYLTPTLPYLTPTSLLPHIYLTPTSTTTSRLPLLLHHPYPTTTPPLPHPYFAPTPQVTRILQTKMCYEVHIEDDSTTPTDTVNPSSGSTSSSSTASSPSGNIEVCNRIVMAICSNDVQKIEFQPVLKPAQMRANRWIMRGQTEKVNSFINLMYTKLYVGD